MGTLKHGNYDLFIQNMLYTNKFQYNNTYIMIHYLIILKLLHNIGKNQICFSYKNIL